MRFFKENIKNNSTVVKQKCAECGREIKKYMVVSKFNDIIFYFCSIDCWKRKLQKRKKEEL